MIHDAWVFPAYAGMFHVCSQPSCVSMRFPRIRGDVPAPPGWSHESSEFSPHTRGCSTAFALVGMFTTCFPRIRGDVPLVEQGAFFRHGFSPHTRGCSEAPWGAMAAEEVFPAYAGMFPPRVADLCWWARFPRIRGDVPSGEWPTT